MKLLLLLLSVLAFSSAQNCIKKTGKQLDNVCTITPNLKVVNHPGTKTVDSKNCNPLFEKTDFADAPKVYFAEADDKKFYTVMMIDPDAPDHGNGKFFLHWIVANVAGSNLKKGDVKGKDVMVYKKPGPPQGTGDHRYMFLVYEQQGDNQKINAPQTGRKRFDLDDWIGKQPRLCGPLAGAQFKANFGVVPGKKKKN